MSLRTGEYRGDSRAIKSRRVALNNKLSLKLLFLLDRCHKIDKSNSITHENGQALYFFAYSMQIFIQISGILAIIHGLKHSIAPAPVKESMYYRYHERWTVLRFITLLILCILSVLTHTTHYWRLDISRWNITRWFILHGNYTSMISQILNLRVTPHTSPLRVRYPSRHLT